MFKPSAPRAFFGKKLRYKQVFAQLSLAAILCLASHSVLAQTTIYSEDFGGEPTTDLHGITPDITSDVGGGTLGATWMAGGNLNADGVASNDLGGTGNAIGMGVALLPFVPQYGFRYTLSADMIGLPGSNNRWMGLGFTRNLDSAWAVNPPGYGPLHWTSLPSPGSPAFEAVLWALTRTGSEAGSFDQYFTGPGTVGGISTTTKSADALKIIVDTTGTKWVVTWLFTTTTGTVGYTNSALLPDWNIKYVGFDSLGGNLGDSIDNFLFSAEVLITDPVAPIIGVQPAGLTNYLGAVGSLSVSDSGTRPVSYQWYYNDLPLVDSTSPSLAFSSLDPTNTGAYYVVLTNIAGATTSSVASVRVFGETNVISPSLSVIKLPTTGTDAASDISSGKHYLCALDFGSVTDPISVNGVPFQQLSTPGMGLGSYFARPLYLGIDDTFGGTWALSGAFPATSGGFNVANGAHTTSDGDFGLLMNDLLAMTTAGSNATLTLTLGGLTPGQSYSLRNYYRKWTTATRPTIFRFNGQGFEETCLVDLDSGGAFRLNYDFVAATNSVTMICEAISGPGPHLYALTLESAAPIPTSRPGMVVQPQGATNWAWASYSMNVQASGTPPVSYQWFKDGVETFGGPSVTLSLSDAGSYQVVAGNAYGFATSQVAVVAFASGEMTLSPSLSLVELPASGTDEASGIWPTNKYLFALDLSDSTSADPLSINGVPFQQVVLVGVGTGVNMNPIINGVDPTYGATWMFSATNRTVTSQGFATRNLSAGQADGNMLFLLDDFGYNHAPVVGDPTVLKLGGLTPGAQYSLRYYFRGYSASTAGRVITFVFNGQGYDESCVVDIDMGGAYYLKYNFTASGTEVTMSMAGFVAAGGHVYGLTLQETAPGAPSLLYSKSGNNLTLSWDTSVTGFTLESTGQIPAINWTSVGGVVNNSVTVDASTGMRFYRLTK